MQVFSLRLKRATGPKQFHSAVLASMQGVMAVAILVRTAWPYPQVRTLIVACAVVFLLLVAVALYRVWKVYSVAYPKAQAGDEVLTRTLNATLRTHLWANGGFLLLALAVFQVSLLLK